MLLKLFNVKDNVTGEFLGLLPARNEADFTRIAKIFLNAKEKNLLNENYKDKTIYLVGQIDTLSGIIEPINPVFWKNVSEIVEEMYAEYKIEQDKQRSLTGKSDGE